MITTADYQQLNNQIKEFNAQLIAVSKFQTIEKIEALYAMGQRDFAENYVQELVTKYEYFKDKPAYKGIKWHFIGHLQRNKVKYIAGFVYMIHSVDSLRLLETIEKEAAKNNRTIHCLLQFHIAQEETKFGLDNTEALEILNVVHANKEAFAHASINGVMGMASFSDNENLVRSEFQQLKQSFQHFKSSFYMLNESFQHISMGMSADYLWALEEGSTLVRIGSTLFGRR